MKAKLFLTTLGLVIGLGLFWYAVSYLSDQLDAALTMVIWSIALTIVAGLIMGLTFGLYFLAVTHEKVMKRRTGLKFLTAGPGEQVFRTWFNERGQPVTSPLHLSAGWANGQAGQASDNDNRRWLAYNTLHATLKRPGLAAGQAIEPVHPLIEAPLPDPFEIMAEMPHLWLVGKTRSGKTNLAMHWLGLKGGDRFVIDPKAPGANDWPQATVAGHNGNESEAVELFQHFMHQARNRIEAGQMDGAPLTFLVDETMFIVAAMASRTGKSVRDTWGELHKMATICAEYKIYLGITSTAPQVGAVGAEGLSGLLSNYSKFETAKRMEQGGPEYDLFYYPETTDPHHKITVLNPGVYRGPGGGRSFDVNATKRTEARRLLAAGVTERQVCLRLLGGDGGEQYRQLRELVNGQEIKL
jgi:hypothetical protein